MFPKGNFISIYVDGEYVPITDPKYGSGAITIATNVTEARNAKGNFVGSVVGADKMKVELSWDILPAEEFTLLCGYFHRPSGGKFVNTYKVYDPRTNSFRSGVKMYISDRQGTPLMVTNGVAKWMQDVRIALVEV